MMAEMATAAARASCQTMAMPSRSARASRRSYRAAATRSRPSEQTVRMAANDSVAMAPASAPATDSLWLATSPTTMATAMAMPGSGQAAKTTRLKSHEK